VQRTKPSSEQVAMIEHIGGVLGVEAAAPRPAPVRRRRKSSGTTARKRGG